MREARPTGKFSLSQISLVIRAGSQAEVFQSASHLTDVSWAGVPAEGTQNTCTAERPKC